jgi:ATP-binding cassette, subfamily F, member 3
VFVSHDRYFVERLATKIVEIGHGTAVAYPGTYKEFLWHKEHPGGRDGQGGRERQDGQVGRGGQVGQERQDGRGRRGGNERAKAPAVKEPPREEKKRVDAEARKHARASKARQAEIDALESRIAECEQAIRTLEQTMSAPGFYEDHAASQPVVREHEALMWKVGELMHQWEELQSVTKV